MSNKIKHMALIKFKEGTAQENVDRVLEQLLDLTENVPGIEDYVAGTNNSPEGLNEGFTHGFVMTFSDAGVRDAYLTHPEHQRVKTEVMPYIDRVLILDFEV